MTTLPTPQKQYVKGIGLVFVAPIQSVDMVHVTVRCPFCNKIHTHGSTGGSGYVGFRVSHCMQSSEDYYVTHVPEDNQSPEVVSNKKLPEKGTRTNKIDLEVYN